MLSPLRPSHLWLLSSLGSLTRKRVLICVIGAIDRFKATDFKNRSSTSQANVRPRSNVYVNPNYKPPSKPSTPAPQIQSQPSSSKLTSLRPDEKKEVIIGGVAFESSGRSLVRKDCTPSFLFILVHVLRVSLMTYYISAQW